MFDSIRETIDYSVEHDISFADILINEEMEREGISRDEVRELSLIHISEPTRR